MEWSEKLQAIIDYVEIHLQRSEAPLNSDEIAKLAGCSYGFFQKVFSYMNGISFAEYVRRRKMTLAGYDLKSTDMKVVDISYKYGYDSPTSFTKAFQQFHGVAPSDARSNEFELKVCPKMQLHSKQKYFWRLEQRQDMRLIGKSIKVSCKAGAHYSRIPEFWNECQRNGVYSKLIEMNQGNPKGLFGLFGAYNAQAEEIEYSIMTASELELPQGFIEITIPSVTWAIFDCVGSVPKAIHDGWRYLNEEWLVKYPFKHAECPELEWYSDGNSFSDDYLSQIWIPIIEEE